MALIDCPECGHRVSQAAVSCPSCGHPILLASAAADPVQVASTASDAGGTLRPRALSFGLTATVASLLWATAAAFTAAAILSLAPMQEWWRAGDGLDAPALVDAENVASVFTGLAYLCFFVGWVFFVTWFFQAYKSAASRGATHTRWGIGWTIGSWFIPVANWVIPKLVMNEVDRMSNPMTGAPPIEDRWEGMPRLGVSDAWWTTLLAGGAIQVIGWSMFASAVYVEDTTYGLGLMAVVVTKTLYAAAAGFMGGLTLEIGKRLRKQN